MTQNRVFALNVVFFQNKNKRKEFNGNGHLKLIAILHVCSVCIYLGFIPSWDYQSTLVDQSTASNLCWLHKDLCRVLVRIWDFVDPLDHNDWRLFIVLDSCCQMGHTKSKVDTLYDSRLHVLCEGYRYLFYNIYRKNRTMVWLNMLFIVTFIGVFKFRIMLGDFSVFSDTIFIICLMHKIATTKTRFVISIHCYYWYI